MRVLLVPALCLVGGCLFGGNNKMKGEIDGNKVSIADGFMVQEDELDELTGDGFVYVVLSDVPDACATFADLNDELEDAETASDLEEAWEAFLPEDFWEITLIMRVSDPGDDLSKIEFDGVGWDDLLDKDDQVYGILTHYQQILDEDYWNGVADPDDYVESWYTDGGDMPIKKHKPNEFIKGSFVTEAAEITDGDTVGDIELQFDVDRCQGAERYYF